MTENTATESIVDAFEGADLDAEHSVDAPTPEEQEAALVEATTPVVEEKPAKIDGIRDLAAFEKGTWQAKIVESARLADRSVAAKKKAGALLWNGAVEAITEWEGKSDVDVHAEVLAADLLDIMGTARKGDVSKIKTVALAVKNSGLILADWENLSKAYGEATRLTKTTKIEKAEDDAADLAVESIEAPASTTTAEGAAALLLSKGIDGAIVAILDALNGPDKAAQNHDAHRAFFRAVGVEVQSRVQAGKPKPEPKAPTAPKTVAKAKPTAAKTATKAPAKAKPAAKQTAVAEGEGRPTTAPLAKPAPVKAKPAPVKR